MKTFVTGGAGYIGSVCVEELLKANHTVTVYDSLVEGHRAAVNDQAQFVQGDLGDTAALAQALHQAQPDVIIHFAAFSLVGESMRMPGKYFHNNFANGINLLNAAVETGVKKFVFSSTCAVYGLPEHLPITEDNAFNPINPYGEAKAMMERALRWYHEVHGLDYVALRYFNAAGASKHYGEHHRVETHLIPNILKVALGQKSHIDLFGTDYPTPDGTCIRDYIHVVDLAHAHIRAMEMENCGSYNLGTGSGFSVRDVIAACESVTGGPIKVVEQPRRPGDPPRLVACADKALHELGWKPAFTDLKQIVDTAWQWHQAHPDGYSEND